MTFIKDQAAAWTQIQQEFAGQETVNGPGSMMDATENVRTLLPILLRQYDIRSMLDAPCGDCNWISRIDLDGIEYTGWDLVPAIVRQNQSRWPGRNFERVNLLKDFHKLPQVDLILCRDFTIHLTTEHVSRLLDKFKTSGVRYLLTTNYPAGHNDYTFPPEGHDGRPGYYAHPWNLEIEPFNMTGRVAQIEEDSQHELVLFDMR
jgi:hypothetical protein